LNGSSHTAESRAVSAAPTPQLHVSDYIVGGQLDELLAAGEDIEISWPFASGEPQNWAAVEALW
jgi:actin-related protein 9